MHALLEEVEAYLLATGMGPTTFGKKTLNDGHAVRRMREGLPITSKNMSKMRAFMAANPPKPSADTNSEAAA